VPPEKKMLKEIKHEIKMMREQVVEMKEREWSFS